MKSPKFHSIKDEGPGIRGHWPLITLLILLLAAAFRLVALGDVPPGLAQDEVLDADIALFIRGGEHALFFRHGYGHEPLYHYLAAPFAPLLGDNLLAIRLPSVYLGLLLVALTMRWARRDYGAVAAVVAGLGLAISWWPIIFSRIGIRPILEPVLLVAAVWFWPLRRMALTRRGLVAAALAGLCLGLSIYSYTAARVAPLIPALMIPILAAALVLRRAAPATGPLPIPSPHPSPRGRGGLPRHSPSANTLSPSLSQRARGSTAPRATRAQLAYAAVVLLVSLLVYAPLGLTLRANPELQQRLDQLEGPLIALRAGDARPVAQAALATLGVFSFGGDPRWTYGLPGRPLFDPLTAVLFYAGLALALWRWRRPVYALLPVWLAVALLPSALSPDAPSTVRLVGALPVVYLLPGLAVAAVAGRLRKWPAANRTASITRAVAGVALALALSLAVFNGLRTVRDGFAVWPADLETRLRYQTALRDIGDQWRAGEGGPLVVAEVFYEPIDGATLRRVIGRDPLARWVQTGGGVAGALVWPAGQAARLYVPEYAPLDGELAAAIGLSEPLYRSPGAPSFAVYGLPQSPSVAWSPVIVPFGDPPAIQLTGFAPLNAGDDGQLRLLTWWEVLSPLPADVAMFVHLLDARGNIVAQHDGLDAAAETLRPGDRLAHRHVLSLPRLDSGDYTLVAGLYRRGDGARLPTADGSGVAALGSCRVGEPGSTCNVAFGGADE